VRELPFIAEVLDSLVGRYVEALGPLALAAPVLALVALALAVRPVAGGGRVVAGLLVAAWSAVGIAFHIRTAAQIDFLAPVYGALFLVQASLLAWIAVVRNAMAGGTRRDAAFWTGLGLAVFGIAGYPALAVLAGRAWPSLPIVGVTPDPTAMLTLGLLLLTAKPAPPALLAVPVLWSLVAGATALMLDTPYRLVLPAAAVAAIAVALWSRHSRASG